MSVSAHFIVSSVPAPARKPRDAPLSILERIGFGSSIPEISPSEAHEGRKAGDVVIVDIRDPHEWAQTGLPQGSHPISMNDSSFTERVRNLASEHPTAKIAISCYSGTRAVSAAKALSKCSVKDLVVLKGGIIQWNTEGLPIDKT